MTTIDYAHSPVATRRRAEKAQKIARWCYGHGITADILAVINPEGRRRLAQHVQVPPPKETAGQLGETWQLVLELLEQRAVWDQAHRTDPPAAPVDCVACLLKAGCDSHRHGRACRACGRPLHRVTLAEGYATHPSCDPAAASSAPASPRHQQPAPPHRQQPEEADTPLC